MLVMPLLIDCYNLLHTTMPSNLAGLEEGRLCELLARGPWTRSRERVAVVCDGVVKPGGLAESPAPGVELLYSGRRQSADDVIIDLIDACSSPRRLVVVSNDRVIQRACRRRRGQSWSCEKFIGELARLAASGGASSGGTPPQKQRSLSADEVEQWLETFGIDADEAKRADEQARPWWERED